VIKKQPILKFTPLGYTLDKRQSLAETKAKTVTVTVTVVLSRKRHSEF
jgi:hypothetical protein